MIRWLRAIFEGRRNRPDAGLDTVADRFGTKPIRPEWRTYDEAKGLAGARRARQQTATGRPLPLPSTPSAELGRNLRRLERHAAQVRRQEDRDGK